jgi:hypothetical protein
MGVTKYKPQRSPRTLEMQSSQEHSEQEKTIQSARHAVARSRELIKKSGEIMDASRRWRFKKPPPPPVKFPDCFFSNGGETVMKHSFPVQ